MGGRDASRSSRSGWRREQGSRRPRVPDPLGRWARTLALASLVGALAGLAAVALEMGLHFGTELLIGRFAALGGPSILELRWELVLLPALGGLLSGIVVQRLARHAPGHGTDQMVHAFHRRDGDFSLRGPGVKAVAAIGVISFGGSAGPEGPIAALGAAIGSKVGRGFGLTPRERRVLLISGCAAAVGALFGCPLGGALFAASVLYREPEVEGHALVSAFVASALGYSTFFGLLGPSSRVLSDAANLTFSSPEELPVFVVLGLLCGLVAIVFSLSLSAVERRFAAMRRIPVWLRPAIGGVLTGALACALPQVMDGQYRFVQNAFDGLLFVGMRADPSAEWLAWAALLGTIALAKCVATAFTVGSGAAGGVLGPSVFIGGVLGAALGCLLEGLAPGFMAEPMRKALIPVGMAGVLSASMRTPLAAMVMAMEMTGSFGLIVPLMIVTMAAYIVGRRFGLIDEQVPSASDSPAHAGDAVVHLLEQSRVGDFVDAGAGPRASRATPLPELIGSLRDGAAAEIPVVDEGRLVGIVSLAELRHLLDDSDLHPVVVAADLMSEVRVALHPDDDLYRAVSVLEDQRRDAIPVVLGRGPDRDRFVGMLTRRHVHDLLRGFVETSREQMLHEHAAFAAIELESQRSLLRSALPLSEAGQVQHLRVDEELRGRSLAEIDFRHTRGAEVLAVQTASGALSCPADPHRRLEEGDTLLVLRSAPEATVAP